MKITKKDWEKRVIEYLSTIKEDSKVAELLKDYKELEESRMKKSENRKKIQARNKIAGIETIKVNKKDQEIAKERLAEALLLLK